MNNERLIQATYFIFRVVIGFLFMQIGAGKLFGWFGGQGHVDIATQIGVAALLEFFGGILIMLGLVTKPVAFLLCGEMAVAYFQVHAKQGVWPFLNGGQPAVLFCFIFLYMAARGGGEYSLDTLMKKSRERSGQAMPTLGSATR